MKRLVPVALVVGAGLLLTLFVLLDRPPGPTGDPGTAGVEAFFRSYVDALNTNDASELGRILGDTPESAEVTARLERYGGRAMRDLHVSASREFPEVYRVNLSGAYGDGTPFVIAEVVEWTGTRWHLAALPPPASGESSSWLGAAAGIQPASA